MHCETCTASVWQRKFRLLGFDTLLLFCGYKSSRQDPLVTKLWALLATHLCDESVLYSDRSGKRKPLFRVYITISSTCLLYMTQHVFDQGNGNRCSGFKLQQSPRRVFCMWLSTCLIRTGVLGLHYRSLLDVSSVCDSARVWSRDGNRCYRFTW